MSKNLELSGLDEARRELIAGRVVVLPNPTPLSYGVAATNPQAVNIAKKRPPHQEVAAWVHDDAVWQNLVSLLDLTSSALPVAFALLRRELITLLVPLREHVLLPAWLIPAVREGHVLLYGGRWAPLAQLLVDFPRLYVSSANHTGDPPAATASQARKIFGANVPVVDADAWHDLSRPHSSTTMLRIAPDGELTLIRHGVQDAENGPDTAAYLKRLQALKVSS